MKKIDMRVIGPSHGTRPERLVRMWVRLAGFSCRFNWKKLPGSPDVYLVNRRVAVFTDGRFWHCPGHKKHRVNGRFWELKRQGNRRRDRRIEKELLSRGVSVVRVWDECFSDRRLLWTKKQILRAVRQEGLRFTRISNRGIRASSRRRPEPPGRRRTSRSR